MADSYAPLVEEDPLPEGGAGDSYAPLVEEQDDEGGYDALIDGPAADAAAAAGGGEAAGGYDALLEDPGEATAQSNYGPLGLAQEQSPQDRAPAPAAQLSAGPSGSKSTAAALERELLETIPDEVRESIGGHDWRWNEAWQSALDQEGADADEKAVEVRQRRLNNLATVFGSVARRLARQVIDEHGCPAHEQAVPAIDAGGVAGGDKFMACGVFIKKVTDAHNLYGGDINAMAAAAHELRGARSYLAAGVRGLRLPLMTLVDYCGFRLVCAAVLPIGSGTLAYGSADAGRSVHRDPQVAPLMEEAGRRLNLKPHMVGPAKARKELTGPCDIEAHKGKDGRFYVLDTARVAPPDPIDLDSASKVAWALVIPADPEVAIHPVDLPAVSAGADCRAAVERELGLLSTGRWDESVQLTSKERTTFVSAVTDGAFSPEHDDSFWPVPRAAAAPAATRHDQGPHWTGAGLDPSAKPKPGTFVAFDDLSRPHSQRPIEQRRVATAPLRGGRGSAPVCRGRLTTVHHEVSGIAAMLCFVELSPGTAVDPPHGTRRNADLDLAEGQVKGGAYARVNERASTLAGRPITGDAVWFAKRPGVHLHRLLRPELVLASPVPLCSDAMTGFGRHDAAKHAAEVRAAGRMLVESVIPSLALRLMDGSVSCLSGAALTTLLHTSGVSIRYLMLLRAILPAHAQRARTAILTEVVARCAKVEMRSRLRAAVADAKSVLGGPPQGGESLGAYQQRARLEAARQFCNDIVGSGPSSDMWWQVTLPILIRHRFRLLFDATDSEATPTGWRAQATRMHAERQQLARAAEEAGLSPDAAVAAMHDFAPGILCAAARRPGRSHTVAEAVSARRLHLSGLSTGKMRAMTRVVDILARLQAQAGVVLSPSVQRSLISDPARFLYSENPFKPGSVVGIIPTADSIVQPAGPGSSASTASVATAAAISPADFHVAAADVFGGAGGAAGLAPHTMPPDSQLEEEEQAPESVELAVIPHTAPSVLAREALQQLRPDSCPASSEEARRDLSGVVAIHGEKSPQEAGARLRLARVLLGEGDAAAALQEAQAGWNVLRSMLTRDCDASICALALLADCYMVLGDHDGAIRHLKLALASLGATYGESMTSMSLDHAVGEGRPRTVLAEDQTQRAAAVVAALAEGGDVQGAMAAFSRIGLDTNSLTVSRSHPFSIVLQNKLAMLNLKGTDALGVVEASSVHQPMASFVPPVTRPASLTTALGCNPIVFKALALEQKVKLEGTGTAQSLPEGYFETYVTGQVHGSFTAKVPQLLAFIKNCISLRRTGGSLSGAAQLGVKRLLARAHAARKVGQWAAAVKAGKASPDDAPPAPPLSIFADEHRLELGWVDGSHRTEEERVCAAQGLHGLWGHHWLAAYKGMVVRAQPIWAHGGALRAVTASHQPSPFRFMAGSDGRHLLDGSAPQPGRVFNRDCPQSEFLSWPSKPDPSNHCPGLQLAGIGSKWDIAGSEAVDRVVRHLYRAPSATDDASKRLFSLAPNLEDIERAMQLAEARPVETAVSRIHCPEGALETARQAWAEGKPVPMAIRHFVSGTLLIGRCFDASSRSFLRDCLGLGSAFDLFSRPIESVAALGIPDAGVSVDEQRAAAKAAAAGAGGSTPTGPSRLPDLHLPCFSHLRNPMEEVDALSQEAVDTWRAFPAGTFVLNESVSTSIQPSGRFSNTSHQLQVKVGEEEIGLAWPGRPRRTFSVIVVTAPDWKTNDNAPCSLLNMAQFFRERRSRAGDLARRQAADPAGGGAVDDAPADEPVCPMSFSTLPGTCQFRLRRDFLELSTAGADEEAMQAALAAADAADAARTGVAAPAAAVPGGDVHGAAVPGSSEAAVLTHIPPPTPEVVGGFLRQTLRNCGGAEAERLLSAAVNMAWSTGDGDELEETRQLEEYRKARDDMLGVDGLSLAEQEDSACRAELAAGPVPADAVDMTMRTAASGSNTLIATRCWQPSGGNRGALPLSKHFMSVTATRTTTPQLPVPMSSVTFSVSDMTPFHYLVPGGGSHLCNRSRSVTRTTMSPMPSVSEAVNSHTIPGASAVRLSVSGSSSDFSTETSTRVTGVGMLSEADVQALRERAETKAKELEELHRQTAAKSAQGAAAAQKAIAEAQAKAQKAMAEAQARAKKAMEEAQERARQAMEEAQRRAAEAAKKAGQ